MLERAGVAAAATAVVVVKERAGVAAAETAVVVVNERAGLLQQ